MEAEEAIYTAVSALLTADTGTGGVFNTGSAYFLRGGVEPAGDPRRTVPEPKIVIEVQATDISPFGNPTTAGTKAAFDTIVRVMLMSRRDRGLNDTERGLESRLRAILNRVAPANVNDTADSSTWSFSPMQRIDSGRAGDTGHELRRIAAYRLLATKTRN